MKRKSNPKKVQKRNNEQMLANAAAAAAAKSLQLCPTLCNPIDGSPPGSAVPGILYSINYQLGMKCTIKFLTLVFTLRVRVGKQAAPDIIQI